MASEGMNPATGLPVGVAVNPDFEIPAPPNPELMGKTEEELQKMIEAEQSAPAVLATPPAMPAPAAPGIPQALPSETVLAPVPESAPAEGQPGAVEVPPKFQKPDGTLDEAKLGKSSTALKEYLDMERELTRLRQQRAQPAASTPMPEATAPNAFLENFKKDFERSPEEAVLRLQNAMYYGLSTQFQQQIEGLKAESELKEIVESNPEMWTPEAKEAIKQIRVERPNLTTMDALEIYQGRIARNKGLTGATQSKPQAPITPGGSAPSVSPMSPKATLDQVATLLKGKSGEEQERILAKILPRGR